MFLRYYRSLLDTFLTHEYSTDIFYPQEVCMKAIVIRLMVVFGQD